MMHPRERRAGLSRRDFLRTSLGAAAMLPGAAAILAACSRPGAFEGAGNRVLARPDQPVTLPTFRDPIPTNTPMESGTLRVYNWSDYFYKRVLREFEDQYGVTVEWTTFGNMEEGIQKLVSGQVQADVFFPTTDYIARLVEIELLQPLNHDLIPNVPANFWTSFSDPGPYYDVGWQYTVPYVIFTTGVAYRRDRVDDAEAAAAGYNLLFDPQYDGAVSYYNSYRDALGMMLLRNGVLDPNTGDEAAIEDANNGILQLINENGARLTENGAYDRLPQGEFTVAQSWSGDIVGGQYYLPQDVPVDVLGYWYPSDRRGLIGNDAIAIPANAESPRLAHEFLNFLADEHWGYINFRDYNGYQPPMTSIKPGRLIEEGVVPESLGQAVLGERNFTLGYIQGELSIEADDVWLDAWREIQAGG
jgi:spermidine/putrescine transport system substrate-binding protein